MTGADVHVDTVVGALNRALVSVVGTDPGVSEEDITVALVAMLGQRSRRFQIGQRVVPARWVEVFDQAAAELGCPVCGRTVACRCYVPPGKEPDRTAAGLAAVLPLIADLWSS